MKKLFLSLLFAASLGLTGCGLEGSMSSGAMKNSLNSAGYNQVEVMSRVEATARIEGITWNVDITDALYCDQNKEAILAFFCSNINDAEKFVKENIAVMVRFAEKYSEDPKTGQHNNVAYCGSPKILKAAGIPIGG